MKNTIKRLAINAACAPFLIIFVALAIIPALTFVALAVLSGESDGHSKPDGQEANADASRQ